MRFFFLDRVLEFKKNQEAKAIKNISLSDDVFNDHFPDLPIFPGSYIIESAAQLGGFLVEMSMNTETQIKRAMMAQVNLAKFYSPAEPGDQLLLHAKVENLLEDAAKISVQVTENISSKKVARITLTFVMKSTEFDNIHYQRQNLYRIWTKNLKNFPQIR